VIGAGEQYYMCIVSINEEPDMVETTSPVLQEGSYYLATEQIL